MTTKQTTKDTISNTREKSGRVLKGTVISNKMKDTCTVSVERYIQIPKYKKYIKRSKKYLVHDVGNTAKVGVKVYIRETSPISKKKHFKLVDVKES